VAKGGENVANFPNTKAEALALLFLQKQDFGGITPKELVEKYNDVLEQAKLAVEQAEKERAKARPLVTSNIQIK